MCTCHAQAGQGPSRRGRGQKEEGVQRPLPGTGLQTWGLCLGVLSYQKEEAVTQAQQLLEGPWGGPRMDLQGIQGTDA